MDDSSEKLKRIRSCCFTLEPDRPRRHKGRHGANQNNKKNSQISLENVGTGSFSACGEGLAITGQESFEIMGQCSDGQMHQERLGAKRNRLNSVVYRDLESRIFGKSARASGRKKKDGGGHAGFISARERRLLDRLITQEPLKMPSQNPDTKIRPITASAATGNREKIILASKSEGFFNRPKTAAATFLRSSSGRRFKPPRPSSASRPATRDSGAVKQEVQRQRRLTVGPVDGIADDEDIIRAQLLATAVSGPQIKIEDKITLEHLNKLKTSFEEAFICGSGTLTLDEFKEIIRKSVGIRTKNDERISSLFKKIDSLSKGFIDWDEFCTYMQLEYAEKEDAYLRSKQVKFQLPPVSELTPHRETVLRINQMNDGTFVAVSQDGLISYWSHNMRLKRTKTVMAEQNANRQKQKWITDFVLMPQFNKFILGTGDREIQFYELSTFEPYCQISSLATVPLKLDYCSTGADECLILFGDSQGCVNIVTIQSTGETLRLWKKGPKTDGIASVTVESVACGKHTQFIRWKVHGDWITDLKYYNDIRSVISSANDDNTSLVIGSIQGSTDINEQLKENQTQSKNRIAQSYAMSVTRRRHTADQSVFRVYKGVKTFDFNKDKNVIVTGGMDRVVRLWNPYVPNKPVGMLRGHNAPIFHISVSSDDNRIFTISQDKTVMVWDIHDQSCLLSVRPKSHMIRGDLQACYYSSMTKGLVMAAERMALLSQKLRSGLHGEIPTSHREPVCCCMYNSSFKQLVSCSEASTVKIWDFETGTGIFEFSKAHGEQAITCMTFDTTGRRLVTGGRDGKLRVWNYNSGNCLRTLEKVSGIEEVTDVTYVEMNKNRYVISVGWDRRINIYRDSAQDYYHIQHPLANWADDINEGHTEDIICIAQCPPNLLATSSYDGVVIVWNMVSGHIFCHLKSSEPHSYDDASLDGDLSVCKLIFLKSRSGKKDAASLMSSGPRGCIHFWNIYHGGRLMGLFFAAKDHGISISSMAINSEESVLYTTDQLGFLCVWDISTFCVYGPAEEDETPQCVLSWRAHTESITRIELVEEYNVLVTSALDCTVRLWTTTGEYIGTFGQDEPWDIHQPSTYCHPMVPYDVLVDPGSLPVHPSITSKHTTAEVIHEDSIPDSEDEDDTEQTKSKTPIYVFTRTDYIVDDSSIADELKKRPFDSGTGKRLRHEKFKPRPKDQGGPNAHQNLKCFDLDDDPPEPERPSLRQEMEDPFDISFDA